MDRHMHIALPDERYQAIATLAAQQGMTPEMLAEIWLTERQEAELVRQINTPLPNQLHQRYKTLLTYRDKNTLTADEYAELLQLTDQVELFDAKRVELLITLAHIRQKPLEEVMTELGIGQSPTGRATVETLKVNRPGVANLRRLLHGINRHPPQMSE